MNKSAPTSIRFDEEKLDFIKKAENLPSSQKVVNFLLDKYWWENKQSVESKVPHPVKIKRQNTLTNKKKTTDDKSESLTEPTSQGMNWRLKQKLGIK